MSKAANYDEYISFRKTFSYQYGVTLAINYIFGIEYNLADYLVNLRTGYINIYNLKLNFSSANISPFSVRISRNLLKFLGKTHINS